MKTYLRHRIYNVVDIKELLALEYLDLNGKYKDYSEAHDFWELCYLQQGELCCIIDGKELPMAEGQIAITAPNQEHSYRGDAKAFVVCFESPSQALKALIGDVHTLDEEQKQCMEQVIAEAAQTFRMNEQEQLEALAHPAFAGQQMIILQLEYLLICTLRKINDIIFLDGEDFHADIAEVIKEYFRTHLYSRLNLEQICKRMNYSRSFLCRTFKEQTGESLMACFNRMKLEEAKRLLCTTKQSAARISAELGFSDAKYFNSLFKKKVGVAPAVYRKENKQ